MIKTGLEILAFAMPVRLEYMPWWTAVALFAVVGGFVVILGMRSLNGLGSVRKWTAIVIRLLVVLVMIAILAGLRIQRMHKDLEVWVLRDMSGSTTLVEKKDYPGKSLQESIDDYLRTAAKDSRKKANDRIGVISFQEQAQVDAMPSTDLRLDTRGIPEHGTGTDASKAIELAIASMSPDTNHRIVLITDDNNTTGSIDTAVAAAKSQGIPIDVMPLHYDVQNAVMIERFIAPTWKRENEAFPLSVIVRSTGSKPIPGKLEVYHRTDRDNILLEPPRSVVLKPGLNQFPVHVPALESAGVHRFVAKFTPDAGAVEASGGTISTNFDKINTPSDAITFVRGQGQVLYVDNYREDAGKRFEQALQAQAAAQNGRPVNKINVRKITMDQFPQNLIDLQNYDAVILGNVPRGQGGISPEQDSMLAQYVHDMGGGVVMIGGDETFGAGGWQGSAMEKVLPVDMDVPAQRQVGQGALVLIMHSCEMPDGNYWGLQCAVKAIQTLSEHDEIGIISYDWGGGVKAGGVGGASWDFQLQEKGDGSAVVAAANKMQLGDMPSFDDALSLALNGANGGYALAKSKAMHKHVIIISDGDPAPPQLNLVNQYKTAKVSVSTITVYPHGSGVIPPVMQDIPEQLKGEDGHGGKAYGPIESNPNQLPQIFIKEATIVRRSLIHEDSNGIPTKLVDSSDHAGSAYAGVQLPQVYGMILTSKKNDPKVSMSMVAGKMNDPLLADWQAGLGKTLVFTSDPTAKWAPGWVSSSEYDAFWGNAVHSVERPPMSEDFEVQTTVNGTRGKITVEALNKQDNFLNFLSIGGQVLDPNGKAVNVRLVQTGPGTYEANFDANDPGSYAVALSYHGQKQNGYLRGGVAVNSEPEYRDLKTNDTGLLEIAEKTGGRVLADNIDGTLFPDWNPATADLFSRKNVGVTASPLPVWDILLPILLALILIDVASRRIAWDWVSVQRLGRSMAAWVESLTSVRKVDSRTSLEALKRVREDVAEQKFRPAASAGAAPPPLPPSGRPDPKAKFQAKAGVEGDISQVVGGASDKPIPSAPKKVEPKGAPSAPGGHTGSLLEAKKRAQQQIKKKEEDSK